MKEIINEILKEEEKARQLIEQARNEAQTIINEAKNEAKNMLETSRFELKNSIMQRQDKSEKEFVLEKKRILKVTQEESEGLHASKEKDIPSIAKAIFTRLVSIKE